MGIVTTDQLPGLIREHSGTPYQKILICAPDIEQWLKENSSPRSPEVSPGVMAMLLTGIDIIVAEDSAPGSWRLVRHDHCEVHLPERPSIREPWVSHENCTIIAEHPEASKEPCSPGAG
jgi:hypothetical protein